MITQHTTTQLIAKEGWKYIVFFALLCALSFYFDYFKWITCFFLILTIYIFRNPERIVDEDDAFALISPCDGKIVAIEKDTMKCFDGGKCLRVSIKKSLLDVSLLRSPCGLNFEKTKRKHGLFLSSNDKLSEILNEQIVISCTRREHSFMMRIMSGFFGRKITIFKTIGNLKVAQRFGVLVDGRVDLLLPSDTRIKSAVGDNVKSGQSVIGYFDHKIKDIDANQ